MITLPYSKIENVAPKDDGRTYIQDVWFDKENQALVATDGFILAVVPVEAEDTDQEGHIPLEAIKEARKGIKGRAYIEATPTLVLAPFADDNKGWERPPLPFPDYGQIVPRPDDEYVSITLDARRLLQLAEALCENETRAKRKGEILGITLTFKPDGVSPALVEPVHEHNKPKGRYGIITLIHKPGG